MLTFIIIYFMYFIFSSSTDFNDTIHIQNDNDM